VSKHVLNRTLSVGLCVDRAVQKKSLTMTFTGHTPEDADKLYANLKALAAPLEPSLDDIRAVMDAMPVPQAALR